MEKYQKIITLLDNTPNQPSKFRTKMGRNNDESRETNKIIKLDLKLQW